MATLPKVDLGPTLGVGYIGVSISSIIYGVACLQTFQYYLSSKAKTDRKELHVLVGLLWLLGSVRQALMMYTFYFYLITHNADLLETLLSNPWSIASSIVITATITLIVDGFLVLRIWHLSRGNIFGAFAIAHFVVAVVFSSLELVNLDESIVTLEAKYESLGIGSAALGASTDGLIMLVMAYFLLQSPGTSRRTHNLIYTLLTYTVTTGALCACCSLASVISYVVVPNAFYNYIFNILGAELYINVFLTSLNVRAAVRRGLDNWTTNTIPLTNLTFKSGSDTASRSQDRTNGSRTAIQGSPQDMNKSHLTSADV
ncbi:hypothetical protein V8D89_000146 [Ganoderma adspersum]